MSIIMLKDIRAAFPNIAEKTAVGDGEPAYATRFIVDPNGPHVAAIEQAMLAAATVKWKDSAADVLAMLKEEKKVCFERAPYRNKKTGKVYDGFEGSFNLGTRNAKTRPAVFDKFNNQIGTPEAELTPGEKSRIQSLIYSGCYVHAKVEFWAQDNTYGRRINCGLLGVMFAKDGDSFGGGARPASADDFAGLAQQPMEEVGADDASSVV